MEVSIGHAFIADALWLGLEGATKRYVAQCEGKYVSSHTV